GRRIPVLIAATLFPDDPSQGMAFVLDLTASKQAEEESRRVSEFRERLVGIVGHDLRNPLAVIRMAAEYMMQREDLPVPIVRSVQRIVTSVTRMERIRGALLDFTRSRMGEGLALKPGATRLAEAARQAIEEIGAARPTADVRLEVAGDDRCLCDGQRIVQLLG